MDIIESIASVTKAAVNAGNHELFKELQEISEQAYNLQKDNIELKRRITELEKILNDEKNKTVKNGCYYFNEDGPYCTRCHDVDKNKVLVKESDNGWGKIYDECPQCRTKVLKREYHVDTTPFISSISFD